MMMFKRFRQVLVSSLLAVSAGPAAAQSEVDLAAIVDAWLSSHHADYHSRSFTYWNKEGVVPENCAACHSQSGFVDFLGADGSDAGVVDRPGSVNSVIGCASCHTSHAQVLDSVMLPSGTVLQGLGPNATCTVCHSGRASGDAVSAATEQFQEDTVSPDLAFINVHYGIAAAVTQGRDGRAGFHYPGRVYAGRFRHVPGADTCVACHDAHSSQVSTQSCLTCHRGIEDVRDIRTRHGDFDGDGANDSGISAEINGLHARLHDAILTYAADVSGSPIAYAKATYPYFFNDTDADGTISQSEAVFLNRYSSWTPRLLKAAYNYQVVAKDRGGFVHNPTYLLQLLHDSLANLSQKVATDVPKTRPD